MALDWVNGEGINPNALPVPVTGDEIVPEPYLVIGDTAVTASPVFEGFPSAATLAQPRQAGG